MDDIQQFGQRKLVEFLRSEPRRYPTGFVTLKGDQRKFVYVTQAELHADGTAWLTGHARLDRKANAADISRLDFDGRYQIANDEDGRAEFLIVFPPDVDDEEAWAYRIANPREPLPA
jgi:hypothetical protein